MSHLRVTGAVAVHFPMVGHAAEIGWTSLRPIVAIHKRNGEADVLFGSEFEETFGQFNPWMTEGGIGAFLVPRRLLYDPGSGRP